MRALLSIPAFIAACTTTPATPPAGPVGNRVFVTSQLYVGGLLGGLDGADAKCAERAAAAGFTGTFEAWLSSAIDSPSVRMTQLSSRYTLVDGTLVAENWDDLVSNNMAHPINLDENGKLDLRPTAINGGGFDTGVVPVWSATAIDGTPFFDAEFWSCDGWTDIQPKGRVGDVNSVDYHWTDALTSLRCDDKAPLYCVEQ